MSGLIVRCVKISVYASIAKGAKAKLLNGEPRKEDFGNLFLETKPFEKITTLFSFKFPEFARLHFL